MRARTQRRLGKALMLLAVAIVASAPGVASAHGDGGGATWADAHGTRAGGFWSGTIEDIKDDGKCVSLWTIDTDHNNATMLARACYGDGPVWGQAWGGDSLHDRGIRIWLGDFERYSTLVWPVG